MKKLLLLCACWLTLIPASAQNLSISLTPIDDLAFGTFAAGPGGTVSIGAGGSRTVSGVIDVMPPANGGVARFEVRGDASTAYSISLPSVVSLLRSSGSGVMTLDEFSAVPDGFGVLDGTGRQVLSLGATLHVGANQKPGDYSASFDITVNYQ